MSFRIFKRKVWQQDASFHDRYAPLSTPMNKARTVDSVNTIGEARTICADGNRPWRKLRELVQDDEATPRELKIYYLSDRYEFTEL